MSALPENLNIHPQIKRNYGQRIESIERGTGIDWGTGEALAWATILALDKMYVRIGGEDV